MLLDTKGKQRICGGETMKRAKIRCCCFFTLTMFLLLTLVVEQTSAIRTRPEDYWKETMKGEPIPPAIRDHLQNQKFSAASPTDGSGPTPDYANWDHWDMDPRSTAIIYHHEDLHVDQFDPQGGHH